ncbi:MAG: GlsB/YeaQ/YmgE family stress response membrane protein [Actinobacteria bacterium]|nr:GlsB/YeaQ/YmgE family stress response membrane protein [Actinomycetota bacterium]
MDALGLLLGILVSGLIVGALARLALPGPDPLPLWQTVLLGVLGSVVGGVVGGVVLSLVGVDAGDPAEAGLYGFLSSVVGASLLLILYRRLVQRRGITGPGAQRIR